VEQCSYLLELLAPGRFASRHFNHSPASTVGLPVMTHLTNDLRSHQVVGSANSEMVASLPTFLDAPKPASLMFINQDVCPFD